ncbi:MAG TPA: DUF6056 family protein [Kofleriaceae bacterium]
MKARYAAMIGFCFALAIVYAVVAFWTPIQGDDWNHWIWAGQHRHDDHWFASFAASHFTFADAVSYLLARCRSVHVVLSPVVMVALVVGLFVNATRRIPRPSWQDLLGLSLVSTLLWIGQPAAGVTLFHTPAVALYVYGAAVAVWFIAPLRCGWAVPRSLWPALALAGYCTGSSARVIGAAALVGTIVAIVATPRERRARWMWIALGSLVIGVIAGYASPPWIEFGRVFRRGLEANLTGQGLLRFAYQETGEIIAFVMALVVADMILGVLGRPHADQATRPDARDTLRWVLAAFATTAWCLFGPHYNEATLLPVTCLLVIAALPYVLWLANVRALRLLIVAAVVGVHVIAWSLALTAYHRFGAEGARRMAILQSTKPATTAIIEPYSVVPTSFWFFGEDLDNARMRQLLAIESFGLTDIAFDPPFRKLERNPGIEVVLESDATPAELAAVHAPAIWGTELAAARKQFELLVARLHATTKRKLSLRLVVKNVELPERGARPLLAAWSDSTGTMIPRVARSPLDENAQHTIRIYPPYSREFSEAWIVQGGKSTSAQYHGGSPRVHPLVIDVHVVVVCNKARCLAADAFVPRF